MKVLITGGCHGIGKAITERLKEHEVTSICRHTGFDAMEPSTYPLSCDYDILVNNVGGGGRWSEDEWLEVFLKNVFPMVKLTRLILMNMVSKNWGRIITISSVYGKESGGTPGFTAAKAYQIAWMKAMSTKYKGITFNTICPGGIEIEGKPTNDLPEPHGQPEDVANVVAFLCTDEAKYINGACITVDGGYSKSY